MIWMTLGLVTLAVVGHHSHCIQHLHNNTHVLWQNDSNDEEDEDMDAEGEYFSNNSLCTQSILDHIGMRWLK